MKNLSRSNFVISFLALVWISIPAMRLEGQQSQRQEMLAQGISATVPANWLKAGEMRNAQELRAMKGEAVEGRILTTVEPRTSHADALRRLSEIAAEAKTSVNYIQSGGWPAVQYRITVPLARTGQEKRNQGEKLNHVEKQLAGPPETSQRSVTAVAAGNSVIRIDAELTPNADPKLLDEAESMGRSLALEQKGREQDTQKDLEMLRKGAVSSPQSRRSESSSSIVSRLTPNQGIAKTPAPSAGRTGATEVQSGVGELEMAVSNDGRNVVIGANSGYSYSTNGGSSFTFGGGTPAPFPHDGDPSLGVGASGNFYYSFIGYPDGSAGAKNITGCAVGMSSSSDGGTTFPFLNHAAVCPETGSGLCFTDQPHMAADRYNASSGQDQLYAVWRNFTPSGSAPNCGAIGSGFVTPEITCSANSGQSWTSPAVVGSGDFARLTVGPDGFVYVVYRSGASLLINKFSSCGSGLVQQTGFPVQVAQVTDVTCPVPGLDRCNNGNVLSSQMAAVEETDASHIYVAFAEHTSAANEDIWLGESRDGGATWSTPAAVNASVAARRYMPWVCSSGGSVWVSWYDRRAATAANNDLTDYFSFVGGRFTLPSETNLSQNSDPQCASGWPCGARSANDYNSCSVQPQSGSPGSGCPKYGDYNGNACANGSGYFAWASATAPPGVTAPGGINVFFASQRARIIIPICVLQPWICYGEPNPFPYLYPPDPWIEISSVILDGVIQEINAEQNTVTIRVNNVYAPEFAEGITEKTITASFRYASSLQVGEHLVFFAGGESAGAAGRPEILGVTAPGNIADLKTAMARVSGHRAEEEFRHRVESADLVVTGAVERVMAKEGGGRGRDKDDKDKDGESVAVVQISQVLKGHYSKKMVNVVFPQGTAARWVGAPRFEVGDKGVWILRREHDDEFYRAVGPKDFLLPGELSAVEKMLK
jgi:hypothetical protein